MKTRASPNRRPTHAIAKPVVTTRQPPRSAEPTLPTGRSPSGSRQVESILELQRSAGNKATFALIEGRISVQRTNGESSKASDAVKSLAATLRDLDGYRKELALLADSPALLEKLAVLYGFTLAPNDVRRANNVPDEYQSFVEAGNELRMARGYVREWAETAGKKQLKKGLKKKDRHLLDAFLRAASHYDRIYSKEASSYLTHERVSGDIAPVYGAAAKEVLPAQLVVENAVGTFGDCMRRLTSPELKGELVTPKDVNELFDAYNSHPWGYMAAGTPSPEDLILGRSRGGVCGALAEAFLEMVKLVAKMRQVPNPAYKSSRKVPFVTRRYDRGFIDPAVEGNIHTIDDGASIVTGYRANARCYFQSHTWVEAFGTIYDPLSRQTGDFSDPDFGSWEGSNVSSRDWVLEEVAAPKPGKGFSNGYLLRKATVKEALEELGRQARQIDFEKFKKSYK